MLFLTSELANEAEIIILLERNTTRAWVPGRGIMGRSVGVYKNRYNMWLSSRLQNQPHSFPFVLFNFFFVYFFLFQVPCIQSGRISCSYFIFKVVATQSVEMSFLRAAQYANVSLTHSLTQVLTRFVISRPK